MRAPAIGMGRDGFWAQGFRSPGTGIGIVSNEMGWNFSLQVLGCGVVVGWMYRRLVGLHVTVVEDE